MDGGRSRSLSMVLGTCATEISLGAFGDLARTEGGVVAPDGHQSVNPQPFEGGDDPVEVLRRLVGLAREVPRAEPPRVDCETSWMSSSRTGSPSVLSSSSNPFRMRTLVPLGLAHVVARRYPVDPRGGTATDEDAEGGTVRSGGLHALLR